MNKVCQKLKAIRMAKDADPQLQVADVYDLAADIGKEFEKVIDVYGTDIIKELMTKVIVTLEYLESSAVIIDSLENELIDIKSKVKQLEYEKLEKAEFRNKLDEELEQIEENWRKEINQLNILVSKLQEENKRLSKAVADQEKQSPDKCKALLSDEHLEELKKLKEVTEHQRSQLIHKDKELLEKCSDLEKSQLDTQCLKESNKELFRKNQFIQKQIELHIEEKSDLQACIQNQQREIHSLHKKFKVAMKENMDLVQAEEKQTINLAGKIIMDADDPNRPIFTLHELRHILYEKNDYKAKVSDLEDELSLHRPKTTVMSETNTSTSSALDYDELPVQGPINREPDEKLYPGKKSSGIRRFFRFLRRFSLESPEQLVTFSASP